MRVHLTKEFSRLTRKAGLEDKILLDAVDRAEQGLIDADLGGGLLKQRVSREDQGRSGGFRTIIAYRRGERAIFLHLFAKSGRDNISAVELEAYQRIARGYDRLSDKQIDALAEQSGWRRIERQDG